MKDLLPLIPRILHSEVKRSRFYAGKSESLIMQSDASRKQTGNVEECYQKLYSIIVTAGRATVRGETSPEQTRRIKNL